jgi:hypothetical protein
MKTLVVVLALLFTATTTGCATEDDARFTLPNDTAPILFTGEVEEPRDGDIRVAVRQPDGSIKVEWVPTSHKPTWHVYLASSAEDVARFLILLRRDETDSVRIVSEAVRHTGTVLLGQGGVVVDATVGYTVFYAQYQQRQHPLPTRTDDPAWEHWR